MMNVHAALTAKGSIPMSVILGLMGIRDNDGKSSQDLPSGLLSGIPRNMSV